jgi:hypothetical protein
VVSRDRVPIVREPLIVDEAAGPREDLFLAREVGVLRLAFLAGPRIERHALGGHPGLVGVDHVPVALELVEPDAGDSGIRSVALDTEHGLLRKVVAVHRAAVLRAALDAGEEVLLRLGEGARSRCRRGRERGDIRDPGRSRRRRRIGRGWAGSNRWNRRRRG